MFLVLSLHGILFREFHCFQKQYLIDKSIFGFSMVLGAGILFYTLISNDSPCVKWITRSLPEPGGENRRTERENFSNEMSFKHGIESYSIKCCFRTVNV